MEILQGSSVRDKYGAAAERGFLAVPKDLLAKQKQLQLTSSELNVLLQVLSYWWFVERLPFPTAGMVAEKIGSSACTVRRNLRSLKKKGLLEVKVNTEGKKSFDPTPLVKRLNGISEIVT